MLLAQRNKFRGESVERLQWQVDRNLVDHVTPKVLSKTIEITSKPKITLVKRLQTRPIVVYEAQNTIAEFALGLDTLRKLNSSLVSTKNQDVRRFRPRRRIA